MAAAPPGPAGGGTRIGRSLGAVAAGFLYAVAGIWLTQMVLWFAIPGQPQEDGTQSVPEARLGGTVVCTFGSVILAGFMAAHVAGHAELVHGLALGTLLLAVLAVTTRFVEADPEPPWYQLALPGVALPGTLLGAYLRTRVRRPPPPAPRAPV